MLYLTQSQVHGLQTAEDARLIGVIQDFLRDQPSVDLTGVSDEDLHATCWHAYYRGKALGLRKQKSLTLFAYLVQETGGHALNDTTIEAALTDPGTDPDATMDEILNVAARCAQAGI